MGYPPFAAAQCPRGSKTELFDSVSLMDMQKHQEKHEKETNGSQLDVRHSRLCFLLS